MPVTRVNNVRLFWEMSGQSGDPIVLVHGSWIDHHNWDAVVPLLAREFRVLTYDRRGHSLSERPASYSIREEVTDLTALIETLGIAPAHIIGSSSGGSIVLRVAADRPDLFRSMIVQEPALLDLLAAAPDSVEIFQDITALLNAVIELVTAGEMEGAARRFVETIALGPGAWAEVPHAVKQTVIFNAPAFLDQMRDPHFLTMDLARLYGFRQPALLTRGELSPPFFLSIIEKLAAALPGAEQSVFPGAGHEPELSHPEAFVATVMDFVSRQVPSHRRSSAQARHSVNQLL